jgi:predicted XRE-type DNA-binding protein
MNPDVENGLKQVVWDKPEDCNEAVDENVRIKSNMVDEIILWCNKSGLEYTGSRVVTWRNEGIPLYWSV